MTVTHRSLFITSFAFLGAIGYVVVATVKANGVRYFATYLVCGGIFPAVALSVIWMTDNQGAASKQGTGLIIFGVIGHVTGEGGGFMGDCCSPPPGWRRFCRRL